MRYVSIDIETTGLDSTKHQILSIGAVIEDTDNILPFDEIPVFHQAIIHDEITGNIKALVMNAHLLDIIDDWKSSEDPIKKVIEGRRRFAFCDIDSIAMNFHFWLLENDMTGHINVAGKNFESFDKKFLERLPKWNDLISIRHRVLDPAILYTDWANDETLPNLSECKERAGLDEYVTHDALDDAWDVVQVLRKFYKPKIN